MLSDSKKLTDGLIIYSALISDFERLDFKNDALAGVRANYFNSSCRPQNDKSEITIDDKIYNISYQMRQNEPISWKITRNNNPYQSVIKSSSGVYCVIFYCENGIVYKRMYFDEAHSWLRTEYYSRNYEGVMIGMLSPKNICGVKALNLDRIDSDGNRISAVLYPSDSMPKKKCTGLVYSNVGMLWYDEAYKPEDMPVQKIDDSNKSKGGFVFASDNTDIDFLNLSEAEYLEKTTVDENNAQENKSEQAKQTDVAGYSAYDKIANILAEAHKTNKDLFGEILNQTADSNFNDTENTEKTESDNTVKDKEESVSNDSVQTDAADISEHIINEETIITQSDSVDEETDESSEEYDCKQNPNCNVIIQTKSGKYSYYGSLDENNNRTGKGRTVTSDGVTSYDGEYLNDRRNGFGVCYYKEGKINYVGNWSDGRRNGSGVGYRLSDGTMHAGKWLNNSPDGYGARFDNNGNFIDICMYSNGQRNGKSISFDENGRIHIKMWADGEVVSETVVDAED